MYNTDWGWGWGWGWGGGGGYKTKLYLTKNLGVTFSSFPISFLKNCSKFTLFKVGPHRALNP